MRRVEYFPAECHRVMEEKKEPMLASVSLSAEMICLHFHRMRRCRCEGRALYFLQFKAALAGKCEKHE